MIQLRILRNFPSLSISQIHLPSMVTPLPRSTYAFDIVYKLTLILCTFQARGLSKLHTQASSRVFSSIRCITTLFQASCLIRQTPIRTLESVSNVPRLIVHAGRSHPLYLARLSVLLVSSSIVMIPITHLANPRL